MENLAHWKAVFADNRDGEAFRKVLEGVYNRLQSVSFNSPALATSATASIVETGATWYGIAKGTLITVASGQDMDALVGTVTNAYYNVYVFSVDKASALTTRTGVEGASLAAIKFPAVPDDECVLGFLIIHPTGTGNFVGGTTDIDDGTVVPNAVYVNSVGACALVAPGV